MYYLEKVAEGAEDYYSGEGEEAGQWLGDAAAELGLSGEIEPDQLVAMLTGMNPATGEPLGLRAVAGNGAVPGFDLTFSAPKSVSLTWALGGPKAADEVKAAHQRSVEVALGYMQREACWTRRGTDSAGERVFLQGNGFLAAGYLHRSSRNGDPQLHTHVLIANATKGPDGKWTRLYHPAIYDHAKTAGYIYEAHLRHELTRMLGVEWQPVRKGIAEIKGFKDEWLKAFSTRRAEILEAAGEGASARARQVATLATRKTKEKGLEPGSLRERWLAKAEEIGLDRDAIAATMGKEVELAAKLTLAQLDREVTAHASHFDRRDAIQAVANLLPNGAPGHEVESAADAFLASGSVVTVAETVKGTRYTTTRIWELEREALKTAEQMAKEARGEAGELVAARVIAARPTLKPDQREMVRRLLAGREGIVVVVGEAGTGKSFATVAAAEGWAQAGFELRAAAPTWRAANVLRGDGLEATTVAGLLRDLDRGEVGLSSRSILLVDEAGMVGSEDLTRVIGHADEAGAKLVLVGDPEQLGPIEAGGLFSAIAERTEPVHLHEVIRHNHELDREAAKLIREGEGREALSLYRSEERITVAGNAEERRVVMVEDWWRSYSQGEDALMVAKRNVEVERLNATARELVRSEGRLGSEEIEVGGAAFAAGDQVITRVNDRAGASTTASAGRSPRWTPSTGGSSLRASTRPGASRSAATIWTAPPWAARLRPCNTPTPSLLTAPRAPPSTGPTSWPIRAWTSRSSTSPRRAHASRPTSTPRRRSRPSAASTRLPGRSETPSLTLAKQQSATAPRPPRTTRRYEENWRSCPRRRSRRSEASLAPRPASRRNMRRATRVSSARSRNGAARSSRRAPTAKRLKRSAGASAATSCPAPAKASGYSANGWPRRGRGWRRWSRRVVRLGASARLPASFSTPARRKRSQPRGSSRPPTSSKS
ncbi:MAG TPA: MobF family relaxase [Solirubrobacterales bacterium]|nr:MobF family relaxase [Solirubrobacterales bacterium]